MSDVKTKQKSGRPLYFAGTVTISAPRAQVWATLTDPKTAATLTPHVQTWTEIEPRHKFKVKAGIEMGGADVTLPILMTWSDIIAPSQITICAHLVWQKTAIDTCAQLVLRDTINGTEIEFTAETSPLSRALTPIAHPLIGRTLRQFFVNLKSELEAPPELTTAHIAHNPIPVGG